MEAIDKGRNHEGAETDDTAIRHFKRSAINSAINYENIRKHYKG